MAKSMRAERRSERGSNGLQQGGGIPATRRYGSGAAGLETINKSGFAVEEKVDDGGSGSNWERGRGGGGGGGGGGYEGSM